jgi:signal transduction histidine kinase
MFRSVVIVLAMATVAMVLASLSDMLGAISDLSRQSEGWQLVEFVTICLVVAFACFAFGTRRWIDLRNRTEEILKQHSEQLQEAVEQRTRDLRTTQEKLLRSERLAAIGELAGGVAHELRNPLGVIRNAAYFLNQALEEPDPEVRDAVEMLEKEVVTSERIISSLLDFARPKAAAERKVDVNEVVREVLSRSAVAENVEVLSQLDESLPAIIADSGQLAQVFDNIVLNAVQAMPEGGQLRIKSEVISPGRVAISFADTGIGIPAKNLGKLCEPLFSTKTTGIGLGLALTKNLVERHGGALEVESEVGKGSTFTVRLLVSGEEERQDAGESLHPDCG